MASVNKNNIQISLNNNLEKKLLEIAQETLQSSGRSFDELNGSTKDQIINYVKLQSQKTAQGIVDGIDDIIVAINTNTNKIYQLIDSGSFLLQNPSLFTPGTINRDSFFFSNTNNIIEQSGSLQISGSGLFKSGLTGALNRLPDGSNFLNTGNNSITISTGSNGQIIISATGIFQSGITGALNNLPDGSHFLNAGSNITLSTGSNGQITISAIADGLFYTNINNIIEQSGSLQISGSGLFKSGLTGALNRLPDGSHFLNAGNNITLSTGSNGQITINSTDNTSLQTAYNVGNIITASVGSGSVLIAGDTGATTTGRSLLRLKPESGGLDSAEARFPLIMTSTFNDSNSPIILFRTTNSNFGGGEIQLKSTGDISTEISWFNDAGTGGDAGFNGLRYARIFYHGSTNRLRFNVAAGVGYAFHDLNGQIFSINTTPTNEMYMFPGRSSAIVNNSGSLINSGRIVGKSGLLIHPTSLSAISTFGTDIYSFFSGAIGGKNTVSSSVSVFGGDIHISGNLTIDGSFPDVGDLDIFFYSDTNEIIEHSGSLQMSGSGLFYSGLTGALNELPDGDPFLNAGLNITLSTGSNGQITINAVSTIESDNYFFSSVEDIVEQSGSLQMSGSGLFYSGLTGALNELPDGDPFLNAGLNITLSTGSNGQITINAVSTIESDNYFFSVDENIVEQSGSLQMSGSGLFYSGLTGALNELPDGDPFLNAGLNITLSTGSNGQITINSFDEFFHSNINNIIEQSGSLQISGSGLFKSGLTGALNRLPDGSHFLNAGNNITLSTGSNGQITINSFDEFFYSNTNEIIEHSGSLQMSGSGLFYSGLTGALNELPDGSPYLVAGSNITLSTGSNGQITIGSSDDDWTLLNSTLYTTSSIVIGEEEENTTFGSDIYFYVSGGIGERGDINQSISVFGGDLHISGNISVDGFFPVNTDNIFFYSNIEDVIEQSGSLQMSGSGLFYSGLTGALNELPDGSPFLNAGTNITLSTGSNGQITINSTGGGGGGDTFFYSNTNELLEQSGSLQMSGSGLFYSGLTGALNELPDGEPYLAAGANIIISTGSNGQITIQAVTGAAGAGGGQNEIQYNLAGALTASSNFWIEPGNQINITGSVNMSGDLKVGEGVKYNPVFVTASQDILNTDYILGISASSEITLSLPSNAEHGKCFVIKDIAGNAYENHIIVSSSTEQIDGSSTYILATNYSSIKVVYFSFNNSWGII